MIKRVIPFMVLALAGCSSKDSELDRFLQQTKQEPPGGVEPLPEVKPFDSFAYTAQLMRSPFQPGGTGNSSMPTVRPDDRRSREFLEAFAIDTLKMVGTMQTAGRNYGLVQTSDGRLYKVLPGNHIGQNEGRITSIEPSRINIVEIVPDGLGGFMERSAALALNE